MKPIIWLGDSIDRLRNSPVDVRSEAGHQLLSVQNGDVPADFRPMPDVGPGVIELRLHFRNEYRIFYVARFAEAIYVLHCFIKKGRTTQQGDLDLGRKRYAAMLETRKGRI